MKISVSWLKEYVNYTGTTENLCTYLTNTGLEVEGLEKTETIPGGLKGLVVGEVLTCVAHPNADRLKITTVNVGDDEPVQIVCGAPNVATKQKVVVALPGTTLHPLAGEPFKIKKGKIRGEVSNGMICAEDEIGLGKGHDGIMVLQAEVTPGTSAKDYFNIQEEETIEIGLTPNRADATSHIGVARDLVALSRINPDLGELNLNWPVVSDFQVNESGFGIDIEVKDPSACPRYTGLLISGIQVQESPEWLKNRLLSIGLSPINNVVDATNFVLHEMGHPLHAFDASKITAGKVTVQQLPTGTLFTTLDGVERKLNENDLMICNGNEPMCIAGVFGGVSSGVSVETNSVFLESAYFNPVSVRKTAKRHGLNTDASFRYERGVDPELTIYALKRAALLITEIAGGKIDSDIKEFYPQPLSGFSVKLNFNRLNTLAGVDILPDVVKTILEGLDIKVIDSNADELTLAVPAYRVDVQREADVIEEILRIYGFDNIPLPKKMAVSVAVPNKTDNNVIVNRISDFLVSKGFLEGMSNSQTKIEHYQSHDAFNADESVKMLNPLSLEYTVMRQSFVHNTLAAINHNQNRQQNDIKLFEFGKTYKKVEGGTLENTGLAITLTGNLTPESWRVSQEPIDFYYLKGLVDSLLNHLGIPVKGLKITDDVPSYFEYGIVLKSGKQVVGVLGEIEQDLAHSFDVKSQVLLAELNLDLLVQRAGSTKVKHKSISKYPKVRRDLALILPVDVKFDSIEQAAFNTERKLLKGVNLFDVYQGKNLPEGTKSYAVSFEFRDEQKTLTDKHIEKVMEKLLDRFKKDFNASLRS